MSIATDRRRQAAGTASAEGTQAGSHRTQRSRKALAGWIAVVAACLAAAGLAVVTVSGDGDDPPATPTTKPVDPVASAHHGVIEHGSPRAIEGSVEGSGEYRIPVDAHGPFPAGTPYPPSTADDASAGTSG